MGQVWATEQFVFHKMITTKLKWKSNQERKKKGKIKEGWEEGEGKSENGGKGEEEE